MKIISRCQSQAKMFRALLEGWYCFKEYVAWIPVKLVNQRKWMILIVPRKIIWVLQIMTVFFQCIIINLMEYGHIDFDVGISLRNLPLIPLKVVNISQVANNRSHVCHVEPFHPALCGAHSVRLTVG